MELERLQSISEMEEELLTPIRTMLEILQGYELDAKDNREEISELLLDRIDIIRKRHSAEEKLQNLRQCMNKRERGDSNGRTEDDT
jgi:predicted nucleic acid-binding protein